jgi:hypothetical protein
LADELAELAGELAELAGISVKYCFFHVFSAGDLAGTWWELFIVFH